MKKQQQRGLGSGLGALLPEVSQPAGIREIDIGVVYRNPRQPRTYFDQQALEELAASIREHGIIQPLIVSEREANRYELIAGERRWRAAQLAGLTRVPVVVRETTPQQLLELALIENVQRADLNPLEEARAYQALQDEFGLTDAQIAQRVGKNSRETIANARRLLKLTDEAQEALLKGVISAGHGRALLKFEPDVQPAALEAMIAEELSVREAERLGDLTRELGGDIERALDQLRVRRAPRVEIPRGASRASAAQPRQAEQSAEDLDLRRQFEEILGTPVHLARSDKELRVTIVFHTEEKLQEFFDVLNAARAR